MADEIFDETTEEETLEEVLPRDLRRMYEKEKAERVKMAKEVAELNKRVRHSELSKTFAAKGLPDQAVDLFPSDVDVTEESVTQWVEKYGSLFGSQKAVEGQTEAPPTSNTQSTITGAQNASQGPTEGVKQMAETLNQVNNVVASGTPASGAKDYSQSIYDPSFVDDVPFDDFKDWLRSQGAKV